MNGSCENTLRMPASELNEAVLQTVERHALTPQAIEQVIHLTERDEAQEQEATLERERKDIEKRVANVMVAIEAGHGLGSLLTRLRALEERRDQIDRLLRDLPANLTCRAILERLVDGQDSVGKWLQLGEPAAR